MQQQHIVRLAGQEQFLDLRMDDMRRLIRITCTENAPI